MRMILPTSLMTMRLAGVVDEVDAGDPADPGGGLHVDDPRAAAGLKGVLVDVSPLP